MNNNQKVYLLKKWSLIIFIVGMLSVLVFFIFEEFGIVRIDHFYYKAIMLNVFILLLFALIIPDIGDSEQKFKEFLNKLTFNIFK